MDPVAAVVVMKVWRQLEIVAVVSVGSWTGSKTTTRQTDRHMLNFNES